MKTNPLERHKQCGTEFCMLHKAAPDLVVALRGALLWWYSDTRRMSATEPQWVKAARAALRAAGVSE